MSRPDQEKCRLCSKLSAAEANLRHGTQGNRCWDEVRCHNRRSYYRHRGVRNYNRKQQRRAIGVETMTSVPTSSKFHTITLEIPTPAIPAAIAHWYRETKDSPLHALGAELWIGNDRVAKIAPVHCLGLTQMQIKTLLLRILDCFSEHCGIKVERFRSLVELHPLNCSIRPCPMHPHELHHGN